jgi:hypothetical protein
VDPHIVEIKIWVSVATASDANKVRDAFQPETLAAGAVELAVMEHVEDQSHVKIDGAQLVSATYED